MTMKNREGEDHYVAIRGVKISPSIMFHKYSALQVGCPCAKLNSDK